MQSDKRLYTWKKEWVRPYESQLSVYMNFCNVNAVSSSSVHELWDMTPGNIQRMYNDRTNTYAHVSDRFLDKLSEDMLPDGYYDFPPICGIFNYIHTFRYCPECMIQGYHSLLSQIPGEMKCPIHDLDYIDSGQILAVGEKGSYDIYRKTLGMEFPLPQQREDLDYSLIGEKVNKTVGGRNVIGYAAGFDRYSKTRSRIVFSDSTECRKELIKTIDSGFNADDYKWSVWDYFVSSHDAVFSRRSQEDPDYPDGDSNIWYIRDFFSEDTGWEMLDSIMILACLYDSIKDVDIESYPGNYPHMPSFVQSRYPFDDTTMAKASYCYAVRGNPTLTDIFSTKYLYRMYSSASDVRYNGACCAYLFHDNLQGMYSKFKGLKISAKIFQAVLSSIYIADQTPFLGRKYLESIRSKETFNFYTEWESISPLVYEIVQMQSGDINIYRIEL